MIEINNLHKRYEGDEIILDNINIQINDGEIHGLIGSSGAGKSTLLRCISGLETFDNGDIIVDNVHIKGLSPIEMRAYRKNMGMIFQNFSLLTKKDVYSNIALPMECWGYSQEKTKERVYELLTLVNLENKVHSMPGSLSGGEKQRVAIARALSLNPKYILSDESTSSLDPINSLSVIELLKSINRDLGITVIVVTHEMDVVRRLCNRCSLLENGKLNIASSVEDLFLKKSGSLTNLIGDEDLTFPDDGINIRINFPAEGDNFLFTGFIRNPEYDFKLISSNLLTFVDKKVQSVAINIDKNNLEVILIYLKENNLKYHIIGGEIDV